MCFTGLEPSEHVAVFPSPIKKKIKILFGLRPAGAEDQISYDALRKTLFGFLLSGQLAKRFDSLPAAEMWNYLETALI